MAVSIPRVIPGEAVRISASTYQTWKRCPESANARLQGHYGPDTKPAFLGSLAHRIFNRHLNEGPIAPGRFVQVCREEIGGSTLNSKLSGLDLRPSTLTGVIEEARALYERFTRLPEEGFLTSEVDLRHETDDGVELVGTVDAVYRDDLGGYRLVDWKTGELGTPEHQLLFYALLWALQRDDVPARVEAVSVRTGESYHTSPSTEDLHRVGREVAELATQMRHAWSDGASLERHGGPWCRFCPVLPDCDEGRSAEALLG